MYKLVHSDGTTVVLALNGGSEPAIFTNRWSAVWWQNKLTERFITVIEIVKF